MKLWNNYWLLNLVMGSGIMEQVCIMINYIFIQKDYFNYLKPYIVRFQLISPSQEKTYDCFFQNEIIGIAKYIIRILSPDFMFTYHR